MKIRTLGAAALVGAMLTLAGCAVLPFVPLVPLMAQVPRMLFPGHQPTQQVAKVEPLADPAIATAVAASTSGNGDTGIDIPQQDRVAFLPAAQGSIPLRVAAVDLVSDVKARSVGDTVTVNVVESINGESKAQTDLGNKRSISAGVPNFFTIPEGYAKNIPLLNLTSLLSGNSDNSTSGQGDMKAGDTFTATVSAIVTAVNPSGTLSIKGRRKLQVNGENDTILLSGVVRPQDIDSNNMVSSAQVADLELGITGQGQIRDKQGDGFATRLFDWLWLF
jgi:flagellar L-ring protein precursor FlgH